MLAGAVIGAAVLATGTAIYEGHQAVKASNRAVNLTKQQIAKEEADRARRWEAAQPYVQSGQDAATKLGDIFLRNDRSSFHTSPGYDFRLKEGVRAIDQSAASRGQLLSGDTLKGVESYGQGLADEEFNRYIAQLAGIAGSGLSAIGQGSSPPAQGYGQLASLYANQGSVASQTVAGVNNAAQQAISNYIFLQAIKGNRLGQRGGGGSEINSARDLSLAGSAGGAYSYPAFGGSSGSFDSAGVSGEGVG